MMYCFAGSHKRDVGKWNDRKNDQRWTPPFHGDDILYVRETWNADWCDHVIYKADGGNAKAAGYSKGPKWKPSIHMPKEAARIFLRVTNVRAERLQEITEDGMQREGVTTRPLEDGFEKFIAQKVFALLWGGTIKPPDLALYGWEANPWVWVIEFERISKEEIHVL